jgi:hypothetical protein
MGVIGILIVFGAITYRTQRQVENKKILGWKESGQLKIVVLQEWHEHLDI